MEKVLLITFLFESLISLAIIFVTPFSVIFAASLNIFSFINVFIMGYWLRKIGIKYWKIFFFGIALLMLGVGVSICMHVLSGDFDQVLFIGMLLSLVVFLPIYGVLSVLGAYVQSLKVR